MKRRSEFFLIILILQDLLLSPKTVKQLMRNNNLNYQKTTSLLNKLHRDNFIEKMKTTKILDNRIESIYIISDSGTLALETLKKAQKILD